MKQFLIACDIDHTLLNDAGELLEPNREALQRAQELGAVVVLVTARSFAGALPIYQALGLDTPLIVSSGTLVALPDGSPLFTHYLDATVASQVVELFLGTQHHWSFRLAEAALIHPDFEAVKPPFNDPRHYRKTVVAELRQRLGDHTGLITASLYGHGLWPFFENNGWSELGLRGDYYPPSHFNHLECVNLMNIKASKGHALGWLRKHLGLESAVTLALGDSAVDATMFPLGIGIAPANAAPEVRAQADWIAPHCDEAAVAAALERFVFATIA